jgi:hypothetical protein
MAKEPINSTDWAAVAARAQAVQALHLAGYSDKSMAERAKFLMILGLSRAEAAALLGTTDDSMRHVLANASKKEAAAAAAKVGAAGSKATAA